MCGSSWLGSNVGVFRAARKGCILYSYGISTDSSFEQEMVSKHGCEVFAFDPTIGRLKAPPQQARSIHYHKMGIWNSSGSSKSFLLVEHLFDAMRRLNHSYIDVLKVDIEGAEWTVFRDIFERRRGQRGEALPLPFGQLLIELHFQAVSTTVEFFRGMTVHGFRPFSREINLQPCLSGQKPLAVEYSFINPSQFFAGDSDPTTSAGALSSVHAAPPAVTPSWHRPVKAVVYFLTQKSRLSRMQTALRSFSEHFHSQHPHYPVLIFHDDLEPDQQTAMQRSVPQMSLTFIRIQLRVPPHLDSTLVPEMVSHCSPNSSTIGYRHMIMFHATGVHRYLMDKKNGYSDTEFLLRLDDDSLFSAPVGYDMFKLMRENNFSYGFVNTVQVGIYL